CSSSKPFSLEILSRLCPRRSRDRLPTGVSGQEATVGSIVLASKRRNKTNLRFHCLCFQLILCSGLSTATTPGLVVISESCCVEVRLPFVHACCMQEAAAFHPWPQETRNTNQKHISRTPNSEKQAEGRGDQNAPSCMA